jgi:hypothetical protein
MNWLSSLFITLAPTCFSIHMPSSGSVLYPYELLERQKWLWCSPTVNVGGLCALVVVVSLSSWVHTTVCAQLDNERTLSRYSDWLRAGRSRDLIPVEVRFSAAVQTGPGPHPASCTMGTESFPGVESGRGVTLTPHPFLCRGLKRE